MDTGNVRTKEELKKKIFNFSVKNFLDYLDVRNSVKKLILQYTGGLNTLDRPRIPNHIQRVIKQKSGCQFLHKMITQSKYDIKYRGKWSTVFQKTIYTRTWNQIFNTF